VFLIRFSRGAKVARELIGPHYRGIAHSDRWGAYSWIAPRKRQVSASVLVLDCRAPLFVLTADARPGTLARGSMAGIVSPG